MTVKELRQILSQLPDEMPVKIGGWTGQLEVDRAFFVEIKTNEFCIGIPFLSKHAIPVKAYIGNEKAKAISDNFIEAERALEALKSALTGDQSE